jgi:predicted MFS family arabinose efflux permease
VPATQTRGHEPVAFGDILRLLGRALAAPGSRALLLFLVTYKTGEVMADTMWKPFLVDAQLSKPLMGTVTLVGMATSIAGSLAGGWLASRLAILPALWIPAAARIAPLGAQALVALHPTAAGVLVVTGLEHLAGGALTTVVFALMMSRVDRKIGASHYTMLAGVEVLGKFPGGFASGPLAAAFGYPGCFAVAAAITAVLLLMIVPLRRAGVR